WNVAVAVRMLDADPRISARCRNVIRPNRSPHTLSAYSSSGCATSTRGLIIASSTLYIVVLSAIARPSDMTAIALKPRCRANERTAMRRSELERRTSGGEGGGGGRGGEGGGGGGRPRRP